MNDDLPLKELQGKLINFEAMKIYHNPRCSKSREALNILNESGKQVEIIEYLSYPPTKDELKDLLAKLGMKASEIVRKSEDLFKEKYKDKKLTNGQWIDILVKNPKLIERPIIVDETRAIIARPPELASDFIG